MTDEAASIAAEAQMMLNAATVLSYASEIDAVWEVISFSGTDCMWISGDATSRPLTLRGRMCAFSGSAECITFLDTDDSSLVKVENLALQTAGTPLTLNPEKIIGEDPSRVTHTSSGSGYETVSALSFVVSEGTTVSFFVRAIGLAGSDVAKFEQVASYTRLTGGSAHEDWNAPVASSPYKVDSAWDFRMNLSTNTVQFQTKANGDNPDWLITVEKRVEALP
jgi:hypothetical protein